MIFHEYRQIAIKTESLIDPYSNKPFSQAQRFLHSGMGLVTESSELLDAYKKHLFYGKKLDKINIEEEIGDICWYLSLWCRLCLSVIEPEMHSRIKNMDIKEVLSVLVYETSEMLRISTFIGHFDCYTSSCSDIYFLCLRIIEIEELSSIETILDRNLSKLAKRYPNKFNNDNAILRDLQAERYILEGKTK